MHPQSANSAALAAGLLVLLPACESQGATAPPPPSSAPAPAAAARREQAAADVARISAALDHYAINNAGRYPDSLVVLVTPDTNGVAYLGTRALPKDPWGNDYGYEAPTPPALGTIPVSLRVFSLGADGRPGGSGEAADVSGPAPKTAPPK